MFTDPETGFRYERRITDGPEASSTFVITPNTSALVTYPEQYPDTANIVAIDVDPNQRKNGMGSFLFDLCVKDARERGCRYLEILCANERTAAMCRRFSEDAVIIRMPVPGKPEFRPTDLTVDEAVDYLATCRELFYPEDNESGQLSEHVSVIAKL